MHRRFERWAIGTICGSGSFKPPSGLDPCLPYGRQDQARRGLLYNATGRISYLWARPVREKRPGGRGIGGRREFLGGCCRLWRPTGRPREAQEPTGVALKNACACSPVRFRRSEGVKPGHRTNEKQLYIYMHHIHPSILVYVSIRATSTHNL